MVKGYIQKIIADKINENKPSAISLEFSFIEDPRLTEEQFFEILEALEEEMQMALLDQAWRFETVHHLVDYINRFR